MQFQIIGLNAENPVYGSADDLLTAATSLGLTHLGPETASHLNPDLIGLPKFKELAGPMHNGAKGDDVRIRYETWEAYELYSQ